MMTSAKEEQEKKTLEAFVQLRRKLLQEHYKQALVTPTRSTTSYQESCGDSSDECDSEDEQQHQQYMEEQQWPNYDDDKKKRNLEYHPKQQLDTRKRKRKESTAVGVKMRSSGKWQAELYFAGKARYIGMFNSREKAALAFDIAMKHLQNKNYSTSKEIDAHFNAARNAALVGVGEEEKIFTQIKFRELSFEERLNELAKYKEVHGHCNVTRGDTKHASLASWVYRLRQTRQGGKCGYHKKEFRLTPAKIAKLDKLGFQWKFVKTFEEHLLDLKEYKAKHGHCNVSRRYEDNKQLGSWVSNIRAAYRAIQAGKKPSHRLTPSMINQLNDMGFSWQVLKR